jgi:hypothetical protein
MCSVRYLCVCLWIYVFTSSLTVIYMQLSFPYFTLSLFIYLFLWDWRWHCVLQKEPRCLLQPFLLMHLFRWGLADYLPAHDFQCHGLLVCPEFVGKQGRGIEFRWKTGENWHSPPIGNWTVDFPPNWDSRCECNQPFLVSWLSRKAGESPWECRWKEEI